MTKSASKNPLKHLRASDLRGIAQLAAQATSGVAHMAEGVHQSVWDTIGVAGGKTPGQTGGLTELIYQSVQQVTRLLGKSVESVSAKLEPQFSSAENAEPGSPQREAVLAALNGVLGDHLAASHNPLATPMTLCLHGAALNWRQAPPLAAVSGKVLLLIHGLCMNDLQWRTQHNGQLLDHGAALAAALGYTPVYLRYNSGLHISQNGHELAAQLEQLLAYWPVPIDELTVVAHSMGGLLIRSAVNAAQQAQLQWPKRLKNIVFLGTPHHGAPLERAGNWIDVILGSTRFTAPFAKLGQLRSAGITDLRYGHLLDQDWRGHDRFRRSPDRRQIVPLPAGVACYAVTATISAQRSVLAERLTGDGLVPLHSALGQHDDAQRTLRFPKPAQWAAYRTNHMELLSSPAVSRQLVQWLTPRRGRSKSTEAEPAARNNPRQAVSGFV